MSPQNLKNLAVLFVLVLASSINSSAQQFSYDWHQNIPTSQQYKTPWYEYSEINGDTLYILGLSVTDSLDANPSTAFDWIHDESLTSVSNIVVISKYLISDGSYLGSFKLMEMPGSSSNAVNIRDFTIDNDGNFIVIGSTSLGVDFDPTLATAGWYSTATSGSFIAFYNVDGSYNAHIEYEATTGPSSSFSVMSANVDDNNNLYVSGRLYGTMDLDFTAGSDLHSSVGQGDGCAIKIDLSNQTYEWGISFGGTQSDDLQYATLSNNNLILYGFFDSPTIDLDPSASNDDHAKIGSYDCTFINQIDPNGNQISGFVTNASYGYNITSDDLGNIYLLGQAEDGVVTDLDPSSATHFLNTDNNSTYYVAKYDANLNFAWARAFSGPNGPDLIAIAVSDSYVSVSGNCYNDLYLSNELVVDTISSPVESELFITALNVNSGNLIQHISFPFSWANNQSGDGLAQSIDNNGDLITLGYFQRELDFNPFDGMTNLDTTAGYLGTYHYNPYVLKLDWLGFSSLEENLIRNGLKVFPNPTNNELNIQSDLAIQSLIIFDLKGRAVINLKTNLLQFINMDLSNLDNGVYFLQTSDIKGYVQTTKIIKK